MKNLLFALLATAAVGFTSCGSSCGAEDIAASATEILNTGQAYASDTSATNCEAYKTALENFVSDHEGCDGVTQDVIDLYTGQAADLDC